MLFNQCGNRTLDSRHETDCFPAVALADEIAPAAALQTGKITDNCQPHPVVREFLKDFTSQPGTEIEKTGGKRVSVNMTLVQFT